VDVKVLHTLLRRPTEAALVMELFDGIPLEAQDMRDVGKIVDIFIQVADALIPCTRWVTCIAISRPTTSLLTATASPR